MTINHLCNHSVGVGALIAEKGYSNDGSPMVNGLQITLGLSLIQLLTRANKDLQLPLQFQEVEACLCRDINKSMLSWMFGTNSATQAIELVTLWNLVTTNSLTRKPAVLPHLIHAIDANVR